MKFKNKTTFSSSCSSYTFWIGGACVPCPSGWYSLNGRCFKWFNGPLNQADAQIDCSRKNSTLVNANTKEKYNLVKSLATSNSYVIKKYFFK